MQQQHCTYKEAISTATYLAHTLLMYILYILYPHMQNYNSRIPGAKMISLFNPFEIALKSWTFCSELDSSLK